MDKYIDELLNHETQKFLHVLFKEIRQFGGTVTLQNIELNSNWWK